MAWCSGIWVLSKRALRNGVSYLGSHERLRVAVAKMTSGQPTVISTIGGSITVGQGCVDGHSWPTYTYNYLNDTYAADAGHITLANGAVSGTMSSYMSVCSYMHVPQDADIIIVEYSQNDVPIANPLFHNPDRRHFERMIHKLLNLPNHPAVVLAHTYSWHAHRGVYWNTAERELQEFSYYYQLPSLSLKSCCYHILTEGPTGLQIFPTRITNRTQYQEKSFYYDPIHLDGRTGSRVMAELAMHLIDSIAAELTAEPLTDDDRSIAALPLPKPMIHHNYESQHERCYLASQFTSSITKNLGFEWINESKTVRAKWGMIATKVGSVLEVTFNSQASSKPHDPDAEKKKTAPPPAEVLVELAYLQSYEHMGRASVSCVSGCTCKPVILEGNTTLKSSQVTLLPLYVTQHHQCVIQVKVLAETSSGEHKVKITGFMVSEEEGKVDGIKNNGAVDFVSDIITGSKDKTFDVRNQVKRRQLHDILTWTPLTESH